MGSVSYCVNKNVYYNTKNDISYGVIHVLNNRQTNHHAVYNAVYNPVYNPVVHNHAVCNLVNHVGSYMWNRVR